MNISWTNIKSAVLFYFDQIKLKGPVEGGKLPHSAYTRAIYNHYYRNVTRNASSHVHDMDEWNSFAKDAVFKPKSKWDNKKLQIQRQGHNHFIDKTTDLQQNDSIITIYHEVRAFTAVSRINVVVKASATGKALYENLGSWLSSANSSVSAWKVMNPQLGSTGPDSAVIYLNENLDSANVKKLVSSLNSKLTSDLEAISVFGLEALAAGLYGFDIPSTDVQQNRLGIQQADQGSAGTIISAIISKAVVLGYQDVIKKQIQEHQQPTYIKAFLDNVLKLDLGWTLVA